ncbi:MAG: hypothetical protein IJJ33_03660 [Victivallales bacterium]|nr:hypothetical protein [Victivallales bacterium]
MNRLLCMLTIVALLAVGCSREYSHYQRGLALTAEAPETALNEYLMAIACDDHAAEAHYQSAMLCAKSPKHAVRLVWHLQSYLALSPQADKNIREWLQKARKTCVASFGADQSADRRAQDMQLRLKLLEEHALRQKQWLTDLRRENEELRRHLGEVQQGL